MAPMLVQYGYTGSACGFESPEGAGAVAANPRMRLEVAPEPVVFVHRILELLDPAGSGAVEEPFDAHAGLQGLGGRFQSVGQATEVAMRFGTCEHHRTEFHDPVLHPCPLP